MGRWAQAQRSGGGQTQPTALAQIVLAEKEDTDATLTWSKGVVAANFDPSTFQSQPSGLVAISVVQLGTAEQTRVTFADAIDSDTSLTYSGTVEGVLTPQTVPLI